MLLIRKDKNTATPTSTSPSSTRPFPSPTPAAKATGPWLTSQKPAFSSTWHETPPNTKSSSQISVAKRTPATWAPSTRDPSTTYPVTRIPGAPRPATLIRSRHYCTRTRLGHRFRCPRVRLKLLRKAFMLVVQGTQHTSRPAESQKTATPKPEIWKQPTPA
jgi:hypothetical protein